MDYEKKYKKTLEKVKSFFKRWEDVEEANTFLVLEELKDIFPELTESKDERIRKTLIKFHKGSIDIDGIKGSEIVSWLEKQKEYESTDFEYVWDRTDCGDLTSALDKYSEEAIINMCHAWYDKGIELERKSWLEKQSESKANGIWFNTKDITAPSERDIIGWYRRKGKLELSPKIVWFCSEEEARKEAEENNDCFLVYWAELPERNFEKNYWFEKQGSKPQGKTALEAVKEEKVDNSNKIELKDYNTIDPHFGKPVDFKAEDWYTSKVDGKIHNFYHSDKPKPKFKVGDWVVDKSGFAQQVLDFRCGIYTCTYNSFSTDCESNYHLWTIDDAKNGDILYIKSGKDEWVIIFISMHSGGYIMDHCSYCINTSFYSDNSVPWGKVSKADIIHPATKEQCDLLFSKIREKGYEWDTKNKQLNEIES